MAAEQVVGDPVPTGLRERKKRMTRELISDTATRMFLQDGFDAVKVADVAAACGISEKTVYNYFSTKESLLLDREPAMAEAIRRALGPGAAVDSPVEAAIGLLSADLAEVGGWWAEQGKTTAALDTFRRFSQMLDHTPSLRAARGDMMARLTQVAAQAMAERGGVDAFSPETQAAAISILGLWQIQYGAIRRGAQEGLLPAEVLAMATAEVERAGRLVESGLWAFAAVLSGANRREDIALGSARAEGLSRKVVAAVRRARASARRERVDA